MWSKLGSVILGDRLPTSQASEQRLSNVAALAILSSDAISSVAYATEELMAILVLASIAALQYTIPMSLAIVGLMGLLVTSYQQLVRAYPAGGGAYSVAKENLGTGWGLVAASGLLIDYILTVAVSVSAGVAALTSAFPALAHLRIELGFAFLLVLMTVNLRGVRDTGRAFTLPTLLFVASMAVVLVVGLVRYVLGDITHSTEPIVPTGTLAGVGLFLLLRAFSSGCTALTGIEAISNSTRVFKKPEVRNATHTLLWMGIILATLFLGVTFLARAFGVAPRPDQTLLSQIAHLVMGGNPFYYVVQVSTLLILLMAANTSFSGFPRLASLLGQDGYLPRQFSDVGSRLVHSNGIILLAALSGLLIAVFEGSVDRLIPLYAVGVFVSFTLSQSGLVRHWLKSKDQGWMHGVAINGLGAIATAIALVVIAITKFTHGAWLVTLLVPAFLYMFVRIHRHYQMVAEELTLQGFSPPPVPRRHIVIVPVGGVHRAVLEALSYARALSGDVRAVYVSTDTAAADAVQRKWQQYVPDVPLDIVPSPYRAVVPDLLRYLDRTRAQGTSAVSVVIPEFIPMHWWELLLHRQTATMLKLALLFHRGIAVISVPHHLRR